MIVILLHIDSLSTSFLHCKIGIVNITTVKVNGTTKDCHYLVVEVNCSDVHYHKVVQVNTFYLTFLY